MLSAAPIRGDGTYYQQLAQTEYYTKGGEPPGHWVGSGAEQLGLIGQAITTQSLKNLLGGFSSDGKEKLVNNAGKDSRQKGYDFTFSAPKDVSVLWAASPEWMKHEIRRAQQAAVEKAIKYLEDEALFTRRGKGGAITERAKASFINPNPSPARIRIGLNVDLLNHYAKNLLVDGVQRSLNCRV